MKLYKLDKIFINYKYMQSNSIDKDKTLSQMYQKSQYDQIDLYENQEKDTTKSFIKEQDDISGFSYYTEEIEKPPKNSINSNNSYDSTKTEESENENLINMTSQLSNFDSSYAIILPDGFEKIPVDRNLENMNEFTLLEFLLNDIKSAKKRVDKNHKKLKFNSIKEFHINFLNKFLNSKYKNDADKLKKDLIEYMHSIDTLSLFENLVNYLFNHGKMNYSNNEKNEEDDIDNLDEEDSRFENYKGDVIFD